MNSFSISGQLVDLHQRRIYPAQITVVDGRIESITPLDSAPEHYILPGFVDAHVHIESSMLVPTAFAQMAVVHGTVATVSDPHEIANVCGMEGVQFMIDNAALTPFKCCFGAPSCVPATGFETAGAALDAEAVDKLLGDKDIWYLSEMMNYPGVLYKDAEVMAKIAAAKKHNKPVDGHAPGLRGDVAKQYASAGISTDHECFTLEEAEDKIAAGMKILIREGSAARNFDALVPLFATHPEALMFCSDDKHPDELEISHINALASRAIAAGHNVYDVLRAACIHPVEHYGLPVGLLHERDKADFIVVSDLQEFKVLQTYIDGQLVAERGKSLLLHEAPQPINQFKAKPITTKSLQVKAEGEVEIPVIEALEGQLITNKLMMQPTVEDGLIISDTERDILKLVVLNRYKADAKPAIALIKNFGLKSGALASTIAHDCHNIIAVGTSDEYIAAAINEVIRLQGGIAVSGEELKSLALPVAGLMSTEDGYTVSRQYTELDQAAKALGCPLRAPFMTLSFMALLVIPSLKLSDKGLFDGEKFAFV